MINGALQSIADSHQKLNIVGLYHVMYQTTCPCNTNKLPRDVHCFYRHVVTKPSFPQITSDIEDIIAEAVRLIEERHIVLNQYKE